MADETSKDYQTQALDMLRAQQEAYLAAVKTWREGLAAAQASGAEPPAWPATPPSPPQVPTPTELAEASYAFAAKVFAEQSRFMEALSQAMGGPVQKKK